MFRSFAFAALAALWLLSSCNGQPKGTATNLQAAAFAGKLKQLPDAPLLDLRSPEEFANGHLDQALNIDWNGTDFDQAVAAMDKTKPVFVYCLSGGRSASAARHLRATGFQEVYELDGGLMKWRAAGLPETTQQAAKPMGMTREAFDALTSKDPVVLVDFYADWCAPCKQMKPYLDEFGTTLAGKVTVLRINADENPELCKAMHIDGLPVIQVYRNGKQTWSHTGYVGKDEVLKQLE